MLELHTHTGRHCHVETHTAKHTNTYTNMRITHSSPSVTYIFYQAKHVWDYYANAETLFTTALPLPSLIVLLLLPFPFLSLPPTPSAYGPPNCTLAAPSLPPSPSSSHYQLLSPSKSLSLMLREWPRVDAQEELGCSRLQCNAPTRCFSIWALFIAWAFFLKAGGRGQGWMDRQMKRRF